LGKNKRKEEIKKKLLEKRKGVFAKHIFIQKLKGLKNALSYVWQTRLKKNFFFFSLAKDGHAKHAFMVRKGLNPTMWVGLLGISPSSQT
jgi:5-formyltetrahydrofolate cyclo-ligase